MQMYDKGLFSKFFLREPVVLQNRSNVIIPQYIWRKKEKRREREREMENLERDLIRKR